MHRSVRTILEALDRQPIDPAFKAGVRQLWENPMEDRFDPNHPSPSAAQLRAEEDREEAREAEATARAERLARIEKATNAWTALKNELAALIETEHTRGKGIRLAHLEDSDHHVLSILEDV